MKYTQIFFLALLVVVFFSCETNVVFKEAMPPEIASINSIPPAFQGIFLCEEDSTLIHSEEDVIFQESHFYFIVNNANYE